MVVEPAKAAPHLGSHRGSMFFDLFARLGSSRFVRDTGSLATGVVVAQLIGLAISPVLTRLFTPADFGVYSLVVSMSSIAGVFATLRLESIIPAVKSGTDAMRLMQLMFGLSCLTGLVALPLIVIFAKPLAQALSLPVAGEATLYLVPVLLVALAFFSGIRAWCIRHGRFEAVSRGQIARAVCAALVWLGLGWTGLAQGPGLALSAGQGAADLVFSGVLYQSLTRREWRTLISPRWGRIRTALKRNANMVRTLVSSQAIAALYSRMPIIVIAAVFGPTQAGFYALAERVVGAPAALIANTIGDVYRQRAANAHRDGLPFDGLMRQVLVLTLALSVVPFVVAMALTPKYFGAVFGQQWQPAAFTMTVMLFGALVAFNSTPIDKAAIIVGASGYILTWHILRLVIEIAAAICACMGVIGYETYLIAIVAGRMGLYAWDVFVEHSLAARQAA